MHQYHLKQSRSIRPVLSPALLQRPDGRSIVTPLIHQWLLSASSQIIPFHPTDSGLPGASAILSLTNAIGWWALVASLVGLVLGAAAWAIGSHSNNYQYSSAGRRAVIVSAMAALVIGAAPSVITFLYGKGQAF
jgi:hypothetical protein